MSAGKLPQIARDFQSKKRKLPKLSILWKNSDGLKTTIPEV